MKVFLTGGTGFIGSRLARQLLARGDKVTALVRKPADAAWLKELGADLAPGDITIPESFRDPMKGADIVHHVAAWYEIGAPDESKMQAINVNGTVNVLKTAGELGVPNIVYCSTVAALGPNRNGIGDESQQNDGHFRSFYEKTKWAAHEEARRLIGEGIPVKIALPSAVYGPADKSLIGLTCRYFVKGWVRVLAFQDSRLTFTHVDDTAEGLRLVADKGHPGEEYIIAGEVLSLAEWMRLMASVTGLPEPRWTIPEKLVRKLLPLTAPIMRWAGLPPRLHLEGLAMTGSWAFSSEKARRELGWNPRSAETGFAETLEWYRLKHSPRP